MLIIKVKDEVVEPFRRWLVDEDLSFTRNGGEFEIPSADRGGFLIGVAYARILNKIENDLGKKPIQEKENIGEDSRGLESGQPDIKP